MGDKMPVLTHGGDDVVMTDQEDLLRALVALGREWHRSRPTVDLFHREPRPGDLVVEVTGIGRSIDPDAIGWLVGHDDAPYGADDPLDGTVPMREVWDIKPLNPAAKLSRIGDDDVQRWENACFVALPQSVAEHLAHLADPNAS